MLPRFVLIIPIIGLLLAAAPVKAQTADSTFTLVPALVDLKADPGQIKDFKMTIYNRSNELQPMKVYAQDFLAKGLDGQITFGDENPTTYAASTWMILSQNDIILDPQSHQDVNVTVHVPSNAEPGGHYASVLFEQQLGQVASSSHSQVQLAARLAGLVYITVSGDIREAGQVLGANSKGGCSAVVCGLDVPGFVDHGPIDFRFIFSNTGNIHVKPKGTITIFQYGYKVATIPVTDQTVLPNAQRKFTTTWNRALLIGPYTAKLHLVYGSHNYPVDVSASFWAFPWQIALVVVLVALIVGGVVVMRKHYSVKRLIAHLD